MTTTFAVSKVARATSRLRMPGDGYRDSPAQQIHGRSVEAWGGNPWPFHPAEEHGLLQAVHIAYARHYPLVLTPDAVWLCIAQGFAIHVNQNAERLRGKFVRHADKATIKVRRDDFVKGSPENPWPEVFGQFSDAIAEHIGRQRDLVVCDFSTTGPCERAASEIVLMDALQQYFKYELWTRCGIPEVTLEGTVEDWISIRRRVRALDEYELSWWTRALEPIIDQLIAAAGGRVDVGFWERMFKEVGGSGGPYVTGWINVLFPYLKVRDGAAAFRRNEAAVDWPRGVHDEDGRGAERFLIPSGISTVPFTWFYFTEKYDMELLAGFVGVAQDEETLALRPAIGWAVRDAGRQAAAAVEAGSAASGSPDDAEPERAPPRLTALPGWLVAQIERGGAMIVAGRMAGRDDFTMRELERAAERVVTLRKESDPRLVCVPAGDLSPAWHLPDAPLGCRLFMGVEVGSVRLIGSWTRSIEAPDGALARARSLPAAVWDALDEVAPGGLTGEVAVYLVLSGRDLRSAVLYGQQDPQYHAWLNWPLSEWGWGAVAAGVSEESPFAVIDTSPEAHARRVAIAEEVGVEAGAGAYYLAMEHLFASPLVPLR